MMLGDALERVFKKTYKIGFLSTLLLDAEETEKRRKQEKNKKGNTHFVGGLENGQEVVPPCFPQKRFFFFPKSSKTPIFIVFPEKWVAAIKKRLCYKEDRFRGAKK